MTADKERFVLTPPASGHLCDFCSSTEVYGAFQCEDFVAFRVEGWELASAGGWSACRVCHDLIVGGEWRKLLDRSVQQFAAKYGVPSMHIRPLVEKTHRLFRERYKLPS